MSKPFPSARPVNTAPERLRRVEGRHNALVKELRAAFSRAELTEAGDCAIEGLRIVEEAIRSGLRFHAVFFRESNTLTSAIYRRNPEDSIFVFFTDDAVVVRPLFGVVNLVVGLAASAVGLATLPVDGGATLWAGLKGAIFSLPELFFQNIRKGSFEHIRRDRLTDPPAHPREAPGGG